MDKYISFPKGVSLLKMQEKTSNKEAESLGITLVTERKRTDICRVLLASVTEGHLPPEGTGMST